MKRAKPLVKTNLAGRPPKIARIESVVRLLPQDGEQVTSRWLVRRLYEKLGLPKRTALRWMKEAEGFTLPDLNHPLVVSIRSGRQRLYGFNMTGFMDPARAEDFLRGAPFNFLREAPNLVEEYKGSLESMTLFWEQASSSLVHSMEHLIAAAQSVSFAQVHERAMPSAAVARAQADVLVEVFLKPWTRDLVATLHRFLEVERSHNRSLTNQGGDRALAPSAMEAYKNGWDWAVGLHGAATVLWVARMKGKRAGPWGAFLERVQREEETRLTSQLVE